jgi:hypothetical protein
MSGQPTSWSRVELMAQKKKKKKTTTTFGWEKKDHTYLIRNLFVCVHMADIYCTKGNGNSFLSRFLYSVYSYSIPSRILHSSNEFHYIIGIKKKHTDRKKNIATVLTPVGTMIRYFNSTVHMLVLLLLVTSITNCPNSGDRSFHSVGPQFSHVTSSTSNSWGVTTHR